MQKYDVAIIGGGASGLALAVSLKKIDSGLSVAIVEAGERLGRKLAATGNGQGNVGNADMSCKHFHGSLAPLAAKLCSSPQYDGKNLFGFLFVKDRLGRIYPASKQASSLSDCLIRKARLSGVQIICRAKVTAIEKGFKLTLSNGATLFSDRAVIAAGGKAQKQFLTDGDAFTLAKSLGHTVTALYPSLVQLKCDTRHIKTLKGIRAECRVSALDSEGGKLCETCGDVIFTDYGLSGNAIFYVSAYCADKRNITLSLEFLPEISAEEIERDVESKLSQGYGQSELLSGTLHNQIGRAVLRRCASSDPAEIAALVKNFTVEVTGSLGFDYAQVTKGGIPAEEVGEDLQSKLVKGLYFTGEALDADGDCGGYNLSWAFSSAMYVAEMIAGAVNADD